MAVTNGGMTLYTDNDNESGWGGTDGADDYNNSIQGSNSESWQVSKNSTETGTLTKSANMGTPKYFTFYMSSNLAPYYTDVRLNVRTNASNYEQWVIATDVDRLVSGDFHPIVAQFGEGAETGTLDETSIADIQIILDNSSSGNIRSVINNWIDAMWYGVGRIIGGSTASDKLFTESHTLDTTTNDSYDGCSELYKGSLSYQTDVEITTTTGNSYGEIVNFAGGYNTDDAYTLLISGTADFQGTSIVGTDGATVAIDATTATSFDMTGGGVTNGGAILLGGSCGVDGSVFTTCARVVPNAGDFSNCTINDTTESAKGAVEIITDTDLLTMSNLTFNNYTGKYALYIPASVTGTITLNNFVGDGSGTDIYWSAVGGTLTVNKANGTNFTTYGSGGGTVDIVASVSIAVNVKNESAVDMSGALVYIDEDLGSAGNIINTTTDGNGDVATSYSGVATIATVRVRKYGFKPYKGTISLTSDSSINVTLITDPQQN